MANRCVSFILFQYRQGVSGGAVYLYPVLLIGLACGRLGSEAILFCAICALSFFQAALTAAAFQPRRVRRLLRLWPGSLLIGYLRFGINAGLLFGLQHFSSRSCAARTPALQIPGPHGQYAPRALPAPWRPFRL